MSVGGGQIGPFHPRTGFLQNCGFSVLCVRTVVRLPLVRVAAARLADVLKADPKD